jgi:hypothetical protein
MFDGEYWIKGLGWRTDSEWDRSRGAVEVILVEGNWEN